MPKEVRVHVRIAVELKERVQEVTKVTGLDEAALVRSALEAIAEYFEEHGEITLPFVMLPKSLAKGFGVAGEKTGAGSVGVPSSPSPARFSLSEEPHAPTETSPRSPVKYRKPPKKA